MRFIVKTSAIILASIASLSAIGISAQESGDKKNKKKSEEIKLIGDPVKCVRPRDVQNTNVLDSKTIEFRMVGGKIYRNNLDKACPGLVKYDPITYTVRGTDLCDVDIFTVLRNTAGILETRATCSFGQFQEIERVKIKT